VVGGGLREAALVVCGGLVARLFDAVLVVGGVSRRRRVLLSGG